MKEAKKLHQQVGVPEGPCGLEEIELFQDYMGPQGYRIIVVDAARGGVIFKCDKCQDAPYRIALVKSLYVDEKNVEKAHYDGLYSVPGFMNRSYFCDKCCKGYNTEDSAHHHCQAKTYPACKQSASRAEAGCPDFTLWTKPDRSWKVCRREFYGESCFTAHLIEYETVDKEKQKIKEQLEKDLDEPLPSIVEMKSVCDQCQRCQDCLVPYKVKKELPQKCLHAQCKHCLEFVPIYDHKCYITSEEEKQFKRQLQELRRKKKEQLLGMVVEGLPDDTAQVMIDQLIAKRKTRLKELDQINSGVPMAEIKAQAYEERLNDVRGKVMLKMNEEEGFELDDITLDLEEESMPKQTEDTKWLVWCLQISSASLIARTYLIIIIMIVYSTFLQHKLNYKAGH